MSSGDASFVITKVEGDGESIAQTRKQMIDALKGIQPGQPVLGAIGRNLTIDEPAPVIENLTPEERKFKKELVTFLAAVLPVPDLGAKFKPEQARGILRKKLERQTLGELRRFWKGKIPAIDDIDADRLEKLVLTWEDLSP